VPGYEPGRRIISGEGGRHCTGSSPGNERLHVLLREDIGGWWDRTLAERENVATGFDFDIPLSATCSRGDELDVFVETRNLTTGEKVQSPRRHISCY
jgi:hypothetical protein